MVPAVVRTGLCLILGAWLLACGPQPRAGGSSPPNILLVVIDTLRADHVCVQVLDPDPTALPMRQWRALAPALCHS